ncbi:efflux RND transporter periplasmic adaptor subunit [Enterobacter asburiae]|uniref:efflux RND transporter periplasmic adaptor subunit n=1 Tax=Enterobacter asburiae TaxID=61645 RepID=UPI00192B491E|nr:efflux RND transporter periplasmic adaptor subunit [Enterobacter asburiae]
MYIPSISRSTWKVIFLAVSITVIILIPILISVQHSELTTYQTATVRLGDIENSVMAIGRLDARKRVNVGAQVSGQLTSLKVKAGDHVIKGQPIAEIDSATQRNDLRKSVEMLKTVEAEIDAKHALLKNANSQYKRQKLMLREGASSREDFESAETSLATTQAELLALKSKLIQMQIDVDKKKVELSYTQVVAPMDGVVISVVAQEGQTVNFSQNTPTIAILAQLDVMTIKVQISEADITKVYEGQKAYFSIFSEAGLRYEAKLRTIELAPESFIKEDSRTGITNSPVYYNALLEVPNPDNRFRIAMSAQVTLIVSEAKNALMIPIQAIKKNENDIKQVQVLTKNNKLETRIVQTGLSNNIDIQITNGLSLGEKVILPIIL